MSNALSTAGKNIALDAWATQAIFASLHSAYPGDTGASEISGGVPAYTREAITWNPAAGGNLDNNANPSFDVPAGTTIAWLGFWTLLVAGTFLGAVPLGGGVPVPFELDDTTEPDLFRADAHGFTEDTKVVLWDTVGAIVPSGFVEGTIYFVDLTGVTDTADTFKLAATAGGAPIAATSDGAGFAQTIIPEVFGGQGTYTTSDVDISADR